MRTSTVKAAVYPFSKIQHGDTDYLKTTTDFHLHDMLCKQ